MLDHPDYKWQEIYNFWCCDREVQERITTQEHNEGNNLSKLYTARPMLE